MDFVKKWLKWFVVVALLLMSAVIYIIFSSQIFPHFYSIINLMSGPDKLELGFNLLGAGIVWQAITGLDWNFDKVNGQALVKKVGLNVLSTLVVLIVSYVVLINSAETEIKLKTRVCELENPGIELEKKVECIKGF